ncbi:MAG: hypothetical protein Q8K99_02975 [Actinomycetota bacterium]|nr:hypothetical protein [Actinomycetota bacterium]
MNLRKGHAVGGGGDWPSTLRQRLVVAVVVFAAIGGFLWWSNAYGPDRGQVFNGVGAATGQVGDTITLEGLDIQVVDATFSGQLLVVELQVRNVSDSFIALPYEEQLPVAQGTEGVLEVDDFSVRTHGVDEGDAGDAPGLAPGGGVDINVVFAAPRGEGETYTVSYELPSGARADFTIAP